MALFCDVDVDAWGQKNRVRLAQDRIQDWWLARTLRDNPTREEIVASTIAFLDKVFRTGALDPRSGVVDNVKVVEIAPEFALPHASWQRREHMNPIPTLRSGPSTFVRVQFSYRGSAPDMPWAVWTSTTSPLLSSKLCPVNADWVLVAAADVDDLGVAPLPPPSVVRRAASAAASAAEAGASWLGMGALLLLALYVFDRRR